MKFDNNVSTFTRLLAACVTGNGKIENNAEIDWDFIHSCALKNDVLSLLLPAFRMNGGVKAENIANIEKRAAIDAYKETKKAVCATKLLKALRLNGITAVVLKGLAYKAFYPYPELRKMSDLDLLIIGADLQDVYSVACSVGNVESAAENHHFTLDSTLNVETTVNLYPDKENALFEEYALNDEINSDSVCEFSFYTDEFLTLSPSQNVLYCAYHMFKHFIFGGVGARQMCDFVLLISKLSDKIDWRYIYEKSQTARMQSYLYSLVRIADMLFGVNVTNAYEIFDKKVDDETVLEVWCDMLDGGVFGMSTSERELARSIVFRKIKGMNRGEEVRGIRAVFPPLSHMRKEFSYVESCPLLLPVGWVHRGAKFTFGRVFKRKRFKVILNAKKSADARLEIIRKLDI
ncbi:MAG: nucleotidyltransferase family protein [Clostridia bacterium]|nr:nucleotidyltransferase family protein [Clostridia bacterium]